MFDDYDDTQDNTAPIIQPKITSSIRSLDDNADIRFGFHDTIFGEAIIGVFKETVISLGFCTANTKPKMGFEHPGYGRDAALEQLKQRFKTANFTQNQASTKPFINQIFGSKSAQIPLTLIGTHFQVEVWNALIQIRWGQTTTYGELAKTLGKPKAARAVGAAVGANPIAWLVPCHRVVSSSGKLHNYHWGIACKQAMLSFEGNDPFASLI